MVSGRLLGGRDSSEDPWEAKSGLLQEEKTESEAETWLRCHQKTPEASREVSNRPYEASVKVSDDYDDS